MHQTNNQPLDGSRLFGLLSPIHSMAKPGAGHHVMRRASLFRSNVTMDEARRSTTTNTAAPGSSKLSSLVFPRATHIEFYRKNSSTRHP